MKKLISLFLTLVIISLTTATAFADEKSVKTEAHFNSFTGIVKEIRKSDLEKGTSYLLLENKEGMEANLVLTKDTYYINDEKISIGSQVTGYKMQRHDDYDLSTSICGGSCNGIK